VKTGLSRTTAWLAAGITAAVLLACAAGAYLYSVHHFEALLQNVRGSMLAEGELIREALEHQMIENDRTLIAEMVRSFGRQPGLSNVVVMDRYGAVQFSSSNVDSEEDLKLESPTCQACHSQPPEERAGSRVIETGDRTLLRTVIPVHNREACHECHDPGHRINGVIMFDRDAGAIRAEMNRDLRWLVAGSGGLALFLIAVIGIIVRTAVLRRLQRFETSARLIAAGDLAHRVPAEGSDTISWLAREFNTMADSVTGLLGEVRHERERLETVINSVDDGIVVLDPDRNVVAANDAFLARTGRSREEATGICCRDLAAGPCRTDDCPTLACLRTGIRQVRICERRTSAGGTTWEEVHASPVRNGTGKVVQVVEVWRDISERRAAEARLAESHRLASLGLLASGFSHELNTPLATVLTSVEGILRSSRTGAGGVQEDWARVAEAASVAREQVLRCRTVTQQFLRLSRGQASPVDIVDVDAALRGAARLVAPAAREHSVSLDVMPVVSPLHVRGDEAELQQVLINLLLNAMQACSHGGRVEVFANGGAPVRISVSDNGCGIAPEHQKRIFEPFFGLRKGGTGLGLFLSLNIVRAWGGDIIARSAPDHGSTFEIVLPSLDAAGTGTKT
jgi:two-component system, NtrC family, sensor kinase